jgi:hypothetical protein
VPNWLSRYLSGGDLRKHFQRALVLGAILRLCSAIFVYGPQALDDYKHGVWPAWQFFAGVPLDLPQYRSHLLIWFLSIFAEMASWIGVTSALGQVRAMYIGLGAVSLLGIVGTYFYVRDFRSRLYARLALYLAAMFPLMPFVSTRAFGEAVAMSLVMLAVGGLEYSRRGGVARIAPWTGWFLILGVAGLFRFHVGLLYLALMVVFAILKVRPALIGAAIAGVIAVGLQAAIDLLSGKGPLGTLFIYLAENEGGGARYGVSPWYNPWLFVLGLTLAPFSFVMWRSTRSLWRKHWPMLAPMLFFVLAHSMAAHKEERFLYPIVGLEVWAIAYLWASNAKNRWARRIYSPVLIGVTALALPAVCFINTQEGEIEPPALMESRYKEVIYLDHLSLFGKSRFQFYFLRPPSLLRAVTPLEFNAARVDQELADHPEHKAVVLLTSEPESRLQLDALAGIKTLEARCLEVRESGSLIDRLLYSLNPKHNQRRRPTWYLACERTPHV